MTDPELMDYPSSQVSAADAAQADRMLFLRKTYSLVLLGVAIFAGTIMALKAEVPVILGLGRAIYGLHPLLLIALLLGSAFGVRMVARTPFLGMAGYIAYAVLLGLLIGPFAAFGAAEGTVTAAAVITLAIFIGLTAYVFITKQDFSWMRGALYVGLFAMIGIALVGWLAGFHLGSWFSIFGALLFSGFILYDTSNVMRTNRVDKALPAAIELFVNVVFLFWHILALMNDD